MNTPQDPRSIKYYALRGLTVVLGAALVVGIAYFILPALLSVSYVAPAAVGSSMPIATVPALPPLNTADYDKRLLVLAHIATSSPWYYAYLQGTTTILLPGATTTVMAKPQAWPKRQPYPSDSRAILPFNRIVAYYGNFYSTGMGVLGEYPSDVVLTKLKAAAAQWAQADPTTPVVPAIEYIDVTAQGSAGKDGKYRARMQDSQVDKALAMAKQINGIVILDIQVGLSTVKDELPLLNDYWKKPEVNLALDPEFDMHNGTPPGRVIGTMSASEINYAINYLSDIVKANNLPPKVLLVHRFTEEMVTGYKDIKPTPQVQVVMVMDGWGFPAKKVNTYNSVIGPEPVQFTGIKLFYKNDLKQTPARLLTMQEVLNLNPSPIYIQYQ